MLKIQWPQLCIAKKKIKCYSPDPSAHINLFTGHKSKYITQPRFLMAKKQKIKGGVTLPTHSFENREASCLFLNYKSSPLHFPSLLGTLNIVKYNINMVVLFPPLFSPALVKQTLRILLLQSYYSLQLGNMMNPSNDFQRYRINFLFFVIYQSVSLIRLSIVFPLKYVFFSYSLLCPQLLLVSKTCDLDIVPASVSQMFPILLPPCSWSSHSFSSFPYYF